MKTILLLSTTLFLLILHLSVFAQAPDLGSASGFALFSSVGAFTNVGASNITGDIGTNAGAFTGFPPGNLLGQSHVADAISAQAAADVIAAYNSLNSLTCEVVLGTALGNDQVLTPHIYCLGAASTLTGNLTLDAQGNPDAIFIFKIDGALAAGASAKVLLTNSASWCNVYWQINGVFGLGEGSVFRGNALVNGAINLLTGVTLNGRALTQAGAINIYTIIATMPSCCGINNAWTNTGGDDKWSTSTNWDMGTVPDNNQTVDIKTGTTLTITDVPDNFHIDKLHIMKNGSAGTNLTLKGATDASVLIIDGLEPCSSIAFEIEDKCGLFCNVPGNRVNIVLMPGSNGRLDAPSTNIPANNAVFEPARYYSCDALSTGNLAQWIDTTYGGNILNYYKTKGLLLRANATSHAELIQQTYNDKKLTAWVECYLPSKPVAFAYNNVHSASIPVSTDLAEIPCCSTTGDILHSLNSLNNYGGGMHTDGYYVRKWDGGLQTWSQRNTPPFADGGWYGNFTNSCDEELNILHTGDAVNNPFLGHVEAGEGIEIIPNPSFAHQPSMVWYGPLNTFSSNVPLTWHVSLPASPNDFGWVLVGNPFASAIKLGELSGSTTAGAGWNWPSTFDPGIWYWDAARQRYRYWNYATHDTLNFAAGSGVTANFIAQNQAFFVYAYSPPTGGVDIFQLDNAARQFQPRMQLMKSVDANILSNTMHLYVTNTDQNFEMDEMAIHFIDKADNSYIRGLDAFKMLRGSNAFSELYTMTTDNTKVAIKNYQSATGPTIIPVYFQVGPAGNYQLKANDLTSFNTHTAITLVDKLLNQTQNLRTNPMYSFAAVTDDEPYRFDILFTDVLYGINNPVSEGIKIYSMGNSIIISCDRIQDLTGVVTVYDIIGNQLIVKSIHDDLFNRINTNLAKGCYLVSLRTENTIINRKVYVNR